MNNFRKKIFNNFCVEFEGCSAAELEKIDLMMYTTILKWFTRDSTLEQLNDELYYILKELYLIDINNPVKYLHY